MNFFINLCAIEKWMESINAMHWRCILFARVLNFEFFVIGPNCVLAFSANYLLVLEDEFVDISYPIRTVIPSLVYGGGLYFIDDWRVSRNNALVQNFFFGRSGADMSDFSRASRKRLCGCKLVAGSDPITV